MIRMVVGREDGHKNPSLLIQEGQHGFRVARIDHHSLLGVGICQHPDVVVVEGLDGLNAKHGGYRVRSLGDGQARHMV